MSSAGRPLTSRNQWLARLAGNQSSISVGMWETAALGIAKSIRSSTSASSAVV